LANVTQLLSIQFLLLSNVILSEAKDQVVAHPVAHKSAKRWPLSLILRFAQNDKGSAVRT
jgi:hypothetical protein